VGCNKGPITSSVFEVTNLLTQQLIMYKPHIGPACVCGGVEQSAQIEIRYQKLWTSMLFRVHSGRCDWMAFFVPLLQFKYASSSNFGDLKSAVQFVYCEILLRCESEFIWNASRNFRFDFGWL